MAPERCLTRICWNENRWEYPSGHAAVAEQDATYAKKMRFGAEEWLFNYQWMLGPWKYGYLTGVSRSLSRVQGKELDIRLYSIDSKSNWFYIGHIHRCRVLTEDLAGDAFRDFKRKGWVRSMVEQVKAVGGNPREFADGVDGLLNIRFKPRDAELYDDPVPVGADDSVRRLKRYKLYQATNNVDVEHEWASRVAAHGLPSTRKRRRSAQAACDVNPIEAQLQRELYLLLVKKHGSAAVAREQNFVDLRLQRQRRLTLIEVKSASKPRFALREALGQLLEYAFVAERKGEKVTELVVAGPGEVTKNDEAYLQHLKKARGLPIRYVCFRAGMNDVDL